MQLLRSIATLIAILMVMPWGAFSGAQASLTRFEHRATSFAPDVGAAFVAVTNDTEQRLAPMPKRCRTAVLIGSACGPDVAIPEASISLVALGSITSVWRAAGVRLVGRMPADPLEPPRTC